MIGTEHLLSFATLMFALGLAGMIRNRHNGILVLLSGQIAVVGLAVFVTSLAALTHTHDGQGMAIVILFAMVAQLITGLALVVCLYRKRQSLDIERALKAKV